MKDHMAELAQILKIDQTLLTVKEELEELPAKVRAVQTELKELETDYQKKKAEWDKLDTQVRQLKQQNSEDAEKLKVKEERLNSIKTTKEYQAVLKEIAAGKTSHKERETLVQQLSASWEKLAQELNPLEGRRQELGSSLEKEQGEISERLEALRSRLKEAEAQLQEHLGSLPEDIRHKFRRVQEKRQPAIARVVDGTCQECFINVPPQLFIEIQKKQEIHSCPNCHRLLFIQLD
jgi:Zn-ribbon protein, possibly nucleic acid-binding